MLLGSPEYGVHKAHARSNGQRTRRYTAPAVRDLNAADVRKFAQGRLAAVGSFASKEAAE